MRWKEKERLFNDFGKIKSLRSKMRSLPEEEESIVAIENMVGTMNTNRSLCFISLADQLSSRARKENKIRLEKNEGKPKL